MCNPRSLKSSLIFSTSGAIPPLLILYNHQDPNRLGRSGSTTNFQYPSYRSPQFHLSFPHFLLKTQGEDTIQTLIFRGRLQNTTTSSRPPKTYIQSHIPYSAPPPISSFISLLFSLRPQKIVNQSSKTFLICSTSYDAYSQINQNDKLKSIE